MTDTNNQKDIRKFVDNLVLPVELRVIKTRKDGTISGVYDDRQKLCETIAFLSDQEGIPAVYVTMNPVKADLLCRGNNGVERWAQTTTGDHEVARRVWLPIDIDPVRPAGIMATAEEREAAGRLADAIVERLRELGMPEPVRCDSGNGAHILYRVDWPNDDAARDAARNLLAELALAFDTAQATVDRTVYNAARIWKVPGTMVRKGEAVPTVGRVHRLASITAWPEELAPASIDLVQAIVEELADARPKKAAAPAATGLPENADPRVVEDLAGWVRSSLERVGVAFKEAPYREGTKWRLKCPICNNGDESGALFLSGKGILSYLCLHANSCEFNKETTPDSGKRLRAFMEAVGLWEEWQMVRPRREEAPRNFAAEIDALFKAEQTPEIVLNNLQLAEKVDAAEAAIARYNSPPSYFAFGDQLCRLQPETGAVKPMGSGGLLELLARAAVWQRRTRTETGFTLTAADPPENLVKVLRERERLRGVPPLARVSDTPLFAADGRLLASPGYDEASGVYLLPSVADFPAVADKPAPADVKKAVDAILDVLVDFPFASPACKAHAVGLLLLPFVRELIAGPTPMHIVDAPEAGTGKGLLVDVFARLATGMPTDAEASTQSEEEWRKKILARLSTAPAYFAIDNVEGRLKSAALMSALTEGSYGDRVLGKTERRCVPVRCVWVLTGNNVEGTQDLARRSVWIRLDAGVENPALRRGFRHKDLVRHVTERRPQLVHACLTIVQAWIAAGRPVGDGRKGRYEEWAGIVGGLLDVAGLPGFLSNEEATARAINTGRDHWAALIAAWADSAFRNRATAAGLYDKFATRDFMLDIVGDARTPVVAFGVRLAKQRDRIYGRWKVVAGRDPATNATFYRLDPVDGYSKPEDDPDPRKPEPLPIVADPAVVDPSPARLRTWIEVDTRTIRVRGGDGWDISSDVEEAGRMECPDGTVIVPEYDDDLTGYWLATGPDGGTGRLTREEKNRVAIVRGMTPAAVEAWDWAWSKKLNALLRDYQLWVAFETTDATVILAPKTKLRPS